jgi:hypothetical protein
MSTSQTHSAETVNCKSSKMSFFLFLASHYELNAHTVEWVSALSSNSSHHHCTKREQKSSFVSVFCLKLIFCNKIKQICRSCICLLSRLCGTCYYEFFINYMSTYVCMMIQTTCSMSNNNSIFNLYTNVLSLMVPIVGRCAKWINKSNWVLQKAFDTKKK